MTHNTDDGAPGSRSKNMLELDSLLNPWKREGDPLYEQYRKAVSVVAGVIAAVTPYDGNPAIAGMQLMSNYDEFKRQLASADVPANTPPAFAAIWDFERDHRTLVVRLGHADMADFMAGSDVVEVAQAATQLVMDSRAAGTE